MTTAAELLGARGPLAKTLPGFELRTGQLEMATAIEKTLRDDGILLCEAGTGTGKTLAYLVPAILSGRRVVVSTATRALQEQIVNHDLPLIENSLGLKPRAAIMKGLGNYLCLRRFERQLSIRSPLDMVRQSTLETLQEWRRRSTSGDIAKLSELPENHPIWREVTSSSDTRLGSGCAHFEDCFVTRMKRDAENAQLIIANHHLFFADLALRGPHPGGVIPDYDAVIFDEAHQLEDIATNFFGIVASGEQIQTLLRDTKRALGRSSPSSFFDEVDDASQALWRELSALTGVTHGRAAVSTELWKGDLARCWHALDSALENVSTILEAHASSSDDISRGLKDSLRVQARRSRDLRTRLAQIAEAETGRVCWFEAPSRLSSAPIDLAPVLQERLFAELPAVVMTSATLALPGLNIETPFAYLRSRLGLDSSLPITEVMVPSPFDFETCALLYTPKDLPAPRTAEFLTEASKRIAELISITGGGTFVLTTSLKSMRSLGASLREFICNQPLWVQGEAPKQKLLADFRESGNGILVATLSFWEGVDVPGAALRLVILEKVPFGVPTDPVAQARAEALEKEGKNPFMDLAVPQASITLKQGFGRLVRSKRDRGIVALLDERVHRRGYGKRLLASLPPARRATTLEEVRDFWSTQKPNELSS